MISTRAVYIAIAITTLGAAISQAQEPTIANTERVGPVSYEEPFLDQGNATAKELASLEGITIGEATRRLRMMHNAGKLAHRLERKHADTFSGVHVKDGRIIVAMTRAEAPDILDGLDADLQGDARVITVGTSLRELRSRAKALSTPLASVDRSAYVSILRDSNEIVLKSPNPELIRKAVLSGELGEASDLRVEQSPPIVMTADIYAGRSFNNGSSTGCTTGFVVLRLSDSKRGVTTAGHCQDPGNFNTNLGCPTCTSGNIPLSLQRRWVSDKDISWYTATSSTHVFPPVWFDGSGYPQVKSAKVSATGDYVCKFGRRTFRTCGYVSAEEVWNPSYNSYFSVVPSNTTYPQMNDVGDSGGPVWFSTNTAVGMVHAKRGGDLLYLEIARLDYDNTGISVLKAF